MHRFAQRLAVSAGAGATLFTVTNGAWLLTGKGDRRGREIVGLAAGSGAAVGVGYALMRPLLPHQPEVAGLTYAFLTGVAVRGQLNAIATGVGRPQRFRLTARRLRDEIVLGLVLAQAERRLGPR